MFTGVKSRGNGTYCLERIKYLIDLFLMKDCNAKKNALHVESLFCRVVHCINDQRDNVMAFCLIYKSVCT